MRPTLPRTSLVFVALSAGSLSAPVATAQSPDRARIDSLFAEFGTETPGAAVAAVRGGRVLVRAGYGMANLDHGVPIGPETVFDIASVSKQFAGMAIATLAERGTVDLDAEARTYLPELPDFGRPITVRHLVHHTSGLRDWPATLAVGGWRMDDVISFDQILRMAWRQRELNFPPGDEYSYSNTGYNLLAEIVSRVSEEPFPAWTQREIFAPLGMTSTHFQADHRTIVSRRAQGYDPAGPGAWRVAPNGLTALGSSSLHSSVDDLARWLINFDTHEVGGRSVVELMRSRGVLTSGDTIAYAFGLSRGEYRGRETWTHSGSWAGNRTYLVHFPELGAGVVVLSNSGAYNPAPRAYAVADALFPDGLGPAPDSPPTPASDGGDGPATAPALGDTELARYAGAWVSTELDTRYVLSVVDGGLVADHARHGRIVLTPRAPELFASDHWFFQPVRFERDPAGNVTTMFVGQGRARNLRFVRDPIGTGGRR